MAQKSVQKVLNIFCQMGKHDKCPSTSKGTKSDPVTFICTCPCHDEGSKPPRKALKMGMFGEGR